MPSRRQFIQSGLTFTTLSLGNLAGIRLAVALPDGHVLALTHFIADGRYRESLAVADRLGKQNIDVLGFSGDITEMWVKTLAPQWKQAPMTLAGVTGSDALFVLETLAWDHGMRVVQREALISAAPQMDGGDVPLVSWIIAPKG